MTKTFIPTETSKGKSDYLRKTPPKVLTAMMVFKCAIALRIVPSFPCPLTNGLWLLQQELLHFFDYVKSMFTWVDKKS